MRHRHDSEHGDRQFHPGQQFPHPPHYAEPSDVDALLDGLPSLTNRDLAPDEHPDEYPDEAFRYQGQGGYGESQGRHAQSGQGRGGVDFGGHMHDTKVSRGPNARGHRGRGPRDYVRADISIADEIVDRMTDDPWIDAREVLIGVEDGLVTLTGNAPTRAMKRRAEDLAATVSGVRDVRNLLRVDDGSASFGPPGAAVRTGSDQVGSGFSSSARPDPIWDTPRDDSNWSGF